VGGETKDWLRLGVLALRLRLVVAADASMLLSYGVSTLGQLRAPDELATPEVQQAGRQTPLI